MGGGGEEKMKGYTPSVGKGWIGVRGKEKKE